MTQKSDVVPHWPHILQQTLSGQGFISVILVPTGGVSVPGTVGPQTAFATGAGIGAAPELRHILTPTSSNEQPFHAQVCLLYSSTFSIVRPFEAAIAEQLSSFTVWYTKHDPSAFGFGVRSGRVPLPQQTSWPIPRVPQRFEMGLKVVNCSPVMPHFDAKEPHPSPDSTLIVWHVPSEFAGGVVSGSVPEEQQTISLRTRVLQKFARVLYVARSAWDTPQRSATAKQPSPAATVVVLQSAR